jgi:serine/threonine protein kinase
MSRLFLGEGTYGKVYKTIRERRVCALKEFKKQEHNPFSEISLALQCDHQNVVKGLDYGEDYLVMEAGSHDLHAEMEREMPSEEKVLSWLPDMFSSLIYLHENKIAHGDVKDVNFVLRRDGSLFLCDLGSCVYQDVQAPYRPTLCSPQVYAQSVHQGKIDIFTDIFEEEEDKFASDVWSLGETLLKMLASDYPFLSRDPLTQYIKYIDNPLAYLFSHRVPPSLVPLLQVLLSPKQKKRHNLRRIAEKFSIPIREGRKPIFTDCKLEELPCVRRIYIAPYQHYPKLVSSYASSLYARLCPLYPNTGRVDFSQACLFLASCVYDASRLTDEMIENQDLAFSIFQRLGGQLYLNFPK